MDLLGNIFGEVRSGPTVPGADVTKPLTIALLQLLASRYLSGGHKAPDEDAEDEFSPDAADEVSPSAVTSGLRGLIKQFNDAGLADHVQSWIGTGPNESATPRIISDALEAEVIDALSQRTGLPQDHVIAILSQVLPQVVDKLT